MSVGGSDSGQVHNSSPVLSIVSRWFPTPRLLAPISAGIDVSDTSIKWLSLEAHKQGLRVGKYGSVALPAGIIVEGVIRNVPALKEALRGVKEQLGGIVSVHVALPEEAAFVFSMYVPDNTNRAQILNLIEFELDGRVPIPPSAATYDFDVINARDADKGEEIGVAVFPRELADDYVAAFEGAGLKLLSLEVEARSIARAVSTGRADEPITLSVDFGASRTGFSVMKRGVPIFTSTVAVGVGAMNRTIMEKLLLSPEQAEEFKNDQGLLADAGVRSTEVETVSGTAAALADEVAKHYHYWDTRRNEKGERMTPVGRVYLLGGGANLKGLADYIALRVQAPTERPNVWQNVCDFSDYIPPIDRRTSLQFTTAIGLALRGI